MRSPSGWSVRTFLPQWSPVGLNFFPSTPGVNQRLSRTSWSGVSDALLAAKPSGDWWPRAICGFWLIRGVEKASSTFWWVPPILLHEPVCKVEMEGYISQPQLVRKKYSFKQPDSWKCRGLCLKCFPPFFFPPQILFLNPSFLQSCWCKQQYENLKWCRWRWLGC